ncbi:MAG: Deacetylases, including yeast histone deacetylase and acetoin utilization protein [uncultured Nocardioidaceae bacterium]|uniref:Deacetylases, including yeast histone deacetylase and acetoin utilization protein n=1 Tax=uncultured Nocardioidaceae bacterium TaxID=253824 RepID=A0A6J4M335_9ACTN|nr:MAG: Deacetylases, including yeast histone deacetylase and acetoin utilization protein [uncultured Nocardioidaceae bacterium]
MSQGNVPVVWSPLTRGHNPRNEVWVGKPMPSLELAARVDAILGALPGHHVVEATASPDALLGRVHDAALLRFLETAAQRWQAGEYVEEIGQDRVVAYLFPTAAMAAGLPLSVPARVHAEAGTFAYDTMTVVGPGTWEAARAAAACAVTAADLVAAGAPLAYALCRPPGHHATPSGFGGSCYLNSAAAAVLALQDAGHARVAVVDVDAHQGNGTAAIFYTRGDVLYGSVHVDPAAGWFPHYVGHAAETGTGEGVGATRNLPVPVGTGDGPWLEAVADLARWAVAGGCSALVVSLGVDAAVDDPESPLRVTHDGYRQAGVLLRESGLPAVVVQEGGYHLPTLGSLVASYLDGHSGG